MAATRTEADLINETLDVMGVLPAGQVAQIEETARVAAKIPSVIASLAGQDLIYVANTDQIPQVYFDSIAKILAYECAPKFGVMGDDLAELIRKNKEAFDTLKIIKRGRPTYETQKTYYF